MTWTRFSAPTSETSISPGRNSTRPVSRSTSTSPSVWAVTTSCNVKRCFRRTPTVATRRDARNAARSLVDRRGGDRDGRARAHTARSCVATIQNPWRRHGTCSPTSGTNDNASYVRTAPQLSRATSAVGSTARRLSDTASSPVAATPLSRHPPRQVRSSRTRCLRTLPVSVCGRASTNRTCLGVSNPARR